ncbi:MAG: hypothetical protein PHQ75_11385 [Thermoguttaceae bacterium]|nr:hypothetical protein [Thermoguttaceae bacterium]
MSKQKYLMSRPVMEGVSLWQTHRNRILIGVVLSCMAFLMLTCSSRAETIDCRSCRCSRHVQGMCCDKDAIYLSFTTILFKTDHHGKILCQRDVPEHHGDICLKDGKLYCATAVFHEKEKKNPRGYDCFVYVYDTDLNFVERIPLDGITVGVDGIEWHAGHFYIGNDKGYKTDIKSNTINIYDEKFNLVGTKTVPGWTWCGVQTICWSNGRFWLGLWSREKYHTLEVDENFKVLATHELQTLKGMYALPASSKGEPRLMVALSLRNQEGQSTAELRSAILKDGKLVWEK